ncbi:MAG: DUF3488 and transglutaminase-like domain-containing protein [Campylobacterota bacterium]|nr:DUF3488 and transglutaminase-like domain-containing protein [Campylobacterota bacterium]
MRFLTNWLSTNNTPSALRLLDIAYIVVIIPLLFSLKLPMLLFVLLSSVLIFKEKKPTTLTLALVGLGGALALFFSLYGSFNFAGISRLKLFIELLIYLLVIAIVLQRLTGVINIYLKLSPLFLLALSLFFFHSITMLFYIVVEIFILILLILWQVMQSNFTKVLRVTALLFFSSLPWVILLFIFFPRISFEHATYGFKGESIKRMGHDGKMYLDNTALLVPSERIVMEVGFKGAVPPPSSLYFRGSVLYKEQQNHWKPLALINTDRSQISFGKDATPLEYKVTLYPTNKRWLYLLDMPYLAPKDSHINADLETTTLLNIKKVLRYNASSMLSSQIEQPLNTHIKNASLSYDKDANPQSQHYAEQILASSVQPSQRLKAVQKLFKTQALTYTLAPKPLDLNNSTDSFLFESKNGYCVHFAAAFTTMVRMVQIPARIVTGYKSSGEKRVKNYLIVREKDAHAWVEVYLDGHWNRIESTALASYIDINVESQEESNAVNSTLSQLNLTLLYFKYQIETWILEYDYLRQMKLFENLKTDMAFLIKFISILSLIILLGIATWNLLRREKCEDKLLCLLKSVVNKLHKKGYQREEDETIQVFFKRIETPQTKDPLKNINQLYHKLRYAPKHSVEEYREFEKVVEGFLKSL